MAPKFFPTQKEFRKWLENNHKKEAELVVGYYKTGSGKRSMTWSQSVDEALCFGWIDGVRKSIDEKSYQIRFTPRKKGSIWSTVNIQKIKQLTKEGLMTPAGIASFKNRKEHKSGIYSHENDEIKFSADYEKKFKKDKAAWNYFQSLAPSYRKSSQNWVMNAKREATRVKRLNELITDSKAGKNMFKNNKYNKK